MLLASCGLFRKTARERSVALYNEKNYQQFVDTSFTYEHTKVDTILHIDGSDDQIINMPFDIHNLQLDEKIIDNPRLLGSIKIIPDTGIRVRLRLKPISVPIIIDKKTATKNNVTWHESNNIEAKQKQSETIHKPSLNWNFLIPMCFGMLLLFLIIYIKTKKLLTK